MDDGPIVISSGSALTPESVAAKTFATSFRGYDQNEVRAYLKRVADALSAAAGRESELQTALAEAHRQAAHPDLDEETLTTALGEQAARLLTNAREAAANIVAEAEKRTARIIGEAEVRIARVRSEADGLLARRSEEADRMTSGLRQAAEATARTLRDRARAEAEAEVESARKQGREMVGEARAVRERMLADLTRRRRTAEVQIEHLRTARVRLLEAYSVVRRTLDEATHELGAAEAEAGPVLAAAAGRVPRRTDSAVDEGRRPSSSERRGSSGAGRAGEQHQQRPAVDAPSAQQLAGPLGRGLVSVGGVGGPRPPSPVEVVPDPPTDEPAPNDPPPTRGPIQIQAATAVEAVKVTPATATTVESSSGADDDDDVDDGPSTGPEPAEAVAPSPASPSPDTPVADVPESPAPDPSPPPPEPLAASAPATLEEPPAVATPPPSAPTEAAPATDAPPAAVAPAPTPSADELFARLRAAQVKAPAAPPSTPTPTPPAGPTVAARTGSSSSSTNGNGNAPAPAADHVMHDAGTPLTVREESALAGRDQVLEPIQADLVRRLRRVLQDEQNEVLDRLRRDRRPTPDTVLPSLDDHVERYQSAAAALLGRAADAGAEFVSSPQDEAGGGGVPSRGWPVEQWAADLAVDLVVPLRDRLESAITEAMSGAAETKLAAYDTGGVSERLGASYRQWKTTEIEQAARHHTSAAFSRGAFAATPAGAQRCWVVDDDGGPCPDCDDNTLAGPVTKGEPFPTGQPHPPAHDGCRCILVAPPS